MPMAVGCFLAGGIILLGGLMGLILWVGVWLNRWGWTVVLAVLVWWLVSSGALHA